MHAASASACRAGHRGHRAGRAAGALAALVLIALSGACDARGSLTSPNTAFSGTDRRDPPEERTIDPALVGVWQRTFFFTDGAGNDYVTQTTWSFRANGTATRIVIAASLDGGLADRFVSDALWSAADGRLEIDWFPPQFGTSRLFYVVLGQSVRIGGETYLRID